MRAARTLAAGLATAVRRRWQRRGPGAGCRAGGPLPLAAFRPNVRPLYEIGEPILVEPRPGFAEGAWSRWAEEASRTDLPALAAWAEDTWS
jgi:hypothetical protein